MKLYIAFSIHGTNTFIIATRQVENVAEFLKQNPTMVQTTSRRPDRNDDNIKLSWTKLNTAAGVPLRAPALVLNRFYRLKKEGWEITTEAFIKKHFRKKG